MVKKRALKCYGGTAERDGTRPTGGRDAHARGGKTKGKTQVNIIIGAHGQHPDGASMQNAPMPMPPRPAPLPVPPAVAGGAPAGMPPMMPQGGTPMPPPGVLPRKSGGRTSYPIHDGSGGGEARLEKIKAYGLKPRA